MTKQMIQFTLMGIAALAIAAMPLHAADEAKPEKPNKEAAAEAGKANRAIPFRGKLASKTDSSITIGARTFEVTAETKIMKAGKSATLADAVVGEDVGGSYQDQDGKLVAKMVRFGPKPEAEPKAK